MLRRYFLCVGFGAFEVGAAITLEERVNSLERRVTEMAERMADLEERLAFKEQKKQEAPRQEPVVPNFSSVAPEVSESASSGWVVEGPLKELSSKEKFRKKSLQDAKKALKSSNLKEAKEILEIITGNPTHADFLEALYHLGSFYLYQEKQPHKAGEYFSKAYLTCLPLQDKKILGIKSLLKFVESLLEQKEWVTAEVSLKEAEKKVDQFSASQQGEVHGKEVVGFKKTLKDLKKRLENR